MISSGIFILPGLAYAKAGPAVIISYLLAGLLSLPGMLSIAEMTTAMPKAGGDCFTIMRSMGPGVGTVAGLLSWFSLSMKTAFALVGMSVFAVAVVHLDFHVVAIAGCLFFLAINILGIKEAGGLQVLMVIGLLGLMVLYIILGLPKVDLENFDPVAPKGLTSVFFTAGFVFVSYAGLLKVASVAEEIKNPSRNIPLGMMLALVIVSLCYTLMVFVTAGVLDSGTLSGSLTPISDGAYVFMGTPGRVALSVAALLAFLTTANAGIMTAARSLVPLSRDRLFPGVFANIGQRFKTPHNALLLTGGFIIVFLFVKLEILIEAASVVLILTNLLSCLSVIILRESGLQNYRPGFRAPLYPWLQIAGIVGFSFILLEMGEEAFLISALLVLGGFCTYWFYGRKRVRTESAVVHLVRRIADKVLVTGTLEAELKQIVRERDDIVLDRFDHLVEESVVLDLEDSLPVEDFFGLVGRELGPPLNLTGPALTNLLLAGERENSSVVSQGLAIPHVVVEGKQTFRILLARCQGGIIFSQDDAPVQMVFVLAGTRDERHFHLQVLAAIGKIIQQPALKSKWMAARGEQALRDVILLAERRRH
jgi:amino acid transporter/mannitol/fructose-specific phosphotransferase system IIA component (Ntr-type)